MSIQDQEPNDALARITREAREDMGPHRDFDRMERLLMERVNVEAQRRKLSRVVGIGAAVLAVAAAAVFYAGRGSEAAGPSASNAPVQTAAEKSAGELTTGAVLVKGHALSRGDNLALGDTLESTDALFRAPGRVVFSVKSTSQDALPARVKVTGTDHPIVLELTRGTVEAQVDKVPSGEAFAVDLQPSPGADPNGPPPEAVRIAVHGTHLRVARNGHHVVLDLTEGVVAVGHAPKSGLTTGHAVIAPAHVEFDIETLDSSFTMSLDPTKVRAAESLAPPAPTTPAPITTLAIAPSNPEPGPGLVVRPVTVDKKQPAQTAPSQVSAREAAQPSTPAPQATIAQPPAPTADPAAAINDALAACVREKLQPGANTLTITSSLSLRVGDDGYVQSARFDPPLDPTVQVCTSNTIFKLRFAEGGTRTVTVSTTR